VGVVILPFSQNCNLGNSISKLVNSSFIYSLITNQYWYRMYYAALECRFFSLGRVLGSDPELDPVLFEMSVPDPE
jgi:hypothetical protein